MAQNPRSGRARGRQAPPEAAASMASAMASEAEARHILTGPDLNADDGDGDLQDAVRRIARRISTVNSRLNNNSTLETMSRLTADSLLNTPVVQTPGAPSTNGRSTVLKDALDHVETTMVNDIFFSEKRRVDDYITYEQIYDLIVQASEAIQTHCDNIVSPDDFTKRDLTAFYTGPDQADSEVTKEIRKRVQQLASKYGLEEKVETAILQSLTKGDYFIAVLNVRQELEGLLTEDNSIVLPETKFKMQDVPSLEDRDMKALVESFQNESDFVPMDGGNIRQEVADYISSFVIFNEDGNTLAQRTAAAANQFKTDLNYKKILNVNRDKDEKDIKKDVSLAKTQIRGSILKMVPPENVIKLYQDDTLFGYYYIEVTGQNIADFGRSISGDQSAVVRSLDQNLTTRAFGTSTGTGPENARDRLINRIIIRTLATRLGKASFLADHEEFAADAYAILARAKREGKRITITYVASDQMVHFRPDGSPGYGTSVLSRVKFISKLYIGALTNAFMRNSIRRPEKLVWYIDVGSDSDGSNAVQSFIRTIKQSEVKFSNLRDITTTINHIGEFHDFYIPTYNGERPVEVETLNMGPAGDVDSPFLDWLKKNIIAGTGVPASMVSAAEDVPFARSLSMDNGRFVRRTVRHQRHYGNQASQLVRMVYKNEYIPLEEMVGKPKKLSEAKGGTIGASIGEGEADDKNSVDMPAEGNEDKGSKKDKGKKEESEPTSEELSGPNIDPEFIEIRFPVPATLGMTNIAEAITASNPIVETVTDIMTAGQDDTVKAAFKLGVAREHLPQLHWDRYDDILKEAISTGAKKKALADAEDIDNPPEGEIVPPENSQSGPDLGDTGSSPSGGSSQFD
jgi:hypothetical protein